MLTSAGRDAELIGAQSELFETALAPAGLTLADVRFDPHDRAFFGGDKYRLPFFDALVENPWKISPYARTLTDTLLADAGSPAGVLVAAQSRLNRGVRLGLVGDPLERYEQRIAEAGDAALVTALAELWGSHEHPPVSPEALLAAPRTVRDAAALVLFAVPDIVRYRNLALERAIPPGQGPATFELLLASVTAESEQPPAQASHTGRELERLLDNVDFGLLNTGATLAALCSERAAAKLTGDATLAELTFKLELPTPHGWVVLAGAQPDTHRGLDSYLLIIDTGGHDQYGAGGGTTDYSNPLSICLDLAGDDTYTTTGPRPAFGAGLLGYGLLHDLGGNDTYEAQHCALGSGLLGTGLHFDPGGDDSYSGVSHVQGSGVYGTGVLIDAAGNDTYDCYQRSQGYGYTLGVGLLLDVAGDDTYRANDADIRYPSPQSAEHNVSMAQGVGNGRRGDYLDGRSWAGGVGMLADGAGDDSYSCGVFGQGCSYWYGVGILADKSGDDAYDGVWYVQGAGAHFGLAVLQDDSGDDSYVATLNMAQGAGHDFNLGWLEDSAGNDRYRAPNLSLGAGNANGIGVLWDKGGGDVYLSRGVTLGAAGGIVAPSLRAYMLNVGIFIDGGGTDSYWEDHGADAEPQSSDFAGNGRAWRRDPMSVPPGRHEYGMGLDR